MALDIGARGRLTLELKREFKAGSKPVSWLEKRAANAMTSTTERSVSEILSHSLRISKRSDWLGGMGK